ncbi:hypothetical protein EW145_g1024 [Phellinidium pouzarii]|uniref:Terpene synthase n=1 Tax=Phellinidium pouzarii TaxID=167371 RepID=A0A4S4LHX7_9AGAM|nr:hypothetical protein EW145_g1024 [Phellinidium pouzarii]
MTYDSLRLACDFINMLFIMDEISDVQDGAGARLTMDKHITILLGGQCDGSAISRMTSSIRTRILNLFGPNSLPRFLSEYRSYSEAIGVEAARRDSRTVISLEDYRIFRRENGAVKPCLVFIEPCFGIDLPDKVFEDPIFKRLRDVALDMILWSNDVYSYKMEQAKPGHSYSNYITVVMKEKGLTIQEAFDYAGTEFQTLMSQFIAEKAALPSFGTEIDNDLKCYVVGLERWVSGNLQFSFETLRYFGGEREEVKKTLIVRLLRPADSNASTPSHAVGKGCTESIRTLLSSKL